MTTIDDEDVGVVKHGTTEKKVSRVLGGDLSPVSENSIGSRLPVATVVRIDQVNCKAHGVVEGRYSLGRW